MCIRDSGCTEQELRELLDPKLYIGRSQEQVEMFLEKVKPLISDVKNSQAKIEL